MSSRTKALKAARVKNLFAPVDIAELQHLARRAGPMVNKKREAARRACRGSASADLD